MKYLLKALMAKFKCYYTFMVHDSHKNAAAVRIEEKSLSVSDSIKIDLPAGGGFVTRFVPY